MLWCAIKDTGARTVEFNTVAEQSSGDAACNALASDGLLNLEESQRQSMM